MGKTYEALERVGKEHQKNLLEISDDPYKELIVKRIMKFPMSRPADRFQEVKTKLLTGFPLGSVKTILFAGTAHGDGCTTIAANFAKTIDQDCRLNVLLIDANLRSPKLHDVFKVEHNKGLTDFVIKRTEELPFRKVSQGNLCLLTCGKINSRPLSIFEATRFDDTLKLMREKFDYVILDAPPVIGYAETKVMGKMVDGVVLVIESGKTRKQVAIRAKQELEDAGAKILGVMLNRRKHYIPGWIYKRL